MIDNEKFKILVVDDDASNIDVLLSILKREYTMFVAKDGPTAIKHARNKSPDLILLDVLMPGMSGFETLTALKNVDITRDIPVIFITGMDEDEDEQRGLALGAVDYIRKPFNNSVVLARVRTQLQIIMQLQTIERLRIKADNATKAKSEFLASMSHEIRTPMNAIIGMSELLLRESLSSRQYAYVKDIKTASTALLEIINDILDFSKIEAGKLSLVPVHYDLHRFIENIASIIEFSAQKKSLRFEVKTSDDLPPFLYGDDVRLRQVLVNVLGNAIKFTEKGFVSFSAKLGQHADTLIFTVEDSGIGIKETDIDRLFGAFEQVDIRKNRNLQGTGLGLSITNSLVAMMGGTINAKSKYGEGTKFFIEIPATLGDEKQIQKDLEIFECVNAPSANILLVDDTELNLNVGEGLFRLCSIICDKATNGREAFEKAQQKDYDIVFMDHLMPVMDGVEATKAIRALGGKYAGLPIIALTANAVDGTKNELMAAGMNDFLSKPIDLPLLNAILKKWLPKEKQLETEKPLETAEPSSEPVYRPVLAFVKGIEGLDINTGLHFVGGAQETYEQTLKSMNQDISVVLEDLSRMLDNDTVNFTIRIHGLGGSLAIVGHESLSAEAKRLESAMKNDNISYCKDRLPGFLSSLKGFNDKLGAAFEDTGLNGSETKQAGDIALVKEALTLISLAVENFEFDTIAKEIEQISRYRYNDELDNTIQKLGKAAEAYDYTLISEIIGMVNLVI